MQGPFSKIAMAVGASAVLATSAIPKPAAADTTSTMNTLLGAAAVVGGIMIYNNVRHKNAQANQIVGYTRNGGTVYADGRIVMPNGQTYYPNANGQSAISRYGYDNGYDPNTYGYSANRYGYNPNGNGYRQNAYAQNGNRGGDRARAWNQNGQNGRDDNR